MVGEHNSRDQLVNPRVVFCPTADTEASSGAKNSGYGDAGAANLSKARKRAYRRARRRAEANGITIYRGRWRSAKSLGTTSVQQPAQTRAVTQSPARPTRQAKPRIRALTYNIGGMDATTYDVFCDWLQQQQDAEIIFVQEIHWGLGKTESNWRVGSWHAFVSPGPRHRYAGVAIFVSSKVAEANQFAYHSVIPGRILHVRCVKQRVTLDLVAGYQHVWQANKKDVVTKQRHTFWNKLGKLLHDLPVRNLLLMGMDLNSGIKPLPGLIGRGVMHTSRHADTELEAMLQVHHLVLLNTWRQASPATCHTFFNNGNRTQLDFIMTRRLTTDAISRLSRPMLLDLTPWRQGPKHRPVQASVQCVAGWTKVKRPTRERKCDVRLLRQAAAQQGSEAQALQVSMLSINKF